MIDNREVARLAKLDGELDALIARRVRQAEEREAWDASAQAYAQKLQDEVRAGWVRYFEHLAEVHTELAVRNRVKAMKLQEGEA